MAAAATLPEQFGRYRIVKLLGQGGMGSVYLARDTQLDRDVALKVPQFVDGKEPQIRDRFYQEARAAATIHHPHVCPVYDVGEVDGILYLTMAFIEGKPLEEWVSSGKPLTPRQIATIGRKVADALGEAHKKGVVHRDLKPANIMIDKRGEPVVMDFGLAHRARADDTRLTRVGTVLGSPAYMSPELIRGDTHATGPGTDVFSLGVILYELIARRLPFDGDTIGAVHAQILLEDPPPLRGFQPDLDPALEVVCATALAKKAEDRYASMAQMAAALKAYLDGVKGSPEPAPKSAPVSAPPAAPPNPVIHGSAFGGRSMVLAQQEEREAAARDRERPKRKKKSGGRPQKRPIWPWVAAGAAVAAVAVLTATLSSRKHADHANTGKDAGPDHADAGKDAGRPVVSAPPVVPPVVPMPNDSAYRPVFNGKDTAGWVTAWGPGDQWRVENGDLTFAATDKASLLKTTDSFTDFVLRFEFQMPPGVDSAVVLRTVPGGPQELIIKINPDGKVAGSIWDWKAVDQPARLNPPGEWNWMEIEVRGKAVRVGVNGVEVNRASLDDPAAAKYFGARPPSTSGQIGFQALSGSARFRKIGVKELRPGASASGADFRPLFDGKSLAGWNVDGDPAVWRVEHGELVVTTADDPKQRGWLLTDQDYTDFVLRLEYQTGPGANSGVAIRTTPGATKQLEVQILDDTFPAYGKLRPNQRTGSLHALVIDNRAELKPVGEWNQLEMTVRGQSLRVAVNGKATVTTSLDSAAEVESLGRPVPTSGRIGLQSWQGSVRFRNVQLKDLGPAAAADFHPLFDGTDLSGWKVEHAEPGFWAVEEDTIIGRPPGAAKAKRSSPGLKLSRGKFGFQANTGTIRVRNIGVE